MGSDSLIVRCAQELQRGQSRGVGAQLVADLLIVRVPDCLWCGFYLTVPGADLLVLGPYQGAGTDLLRVKLGQGTIGCAASSGRTVADGGWIAVPILASNGLRAVLVLECSTAVIEPEVLRLLPQVASLVEPHLPQIDAAVI